MPFDQLLFEIEDHFKRRLFSIADGIFDGVYSHRFQGSNFTSYLGIYENFEDCFNFIRAFIIFIPKVHIKCIWPSISRFVQMFVVVILYQKLHAFVSRLFICAF